MSAKTLRARRFFIRLSALALKEVSHIRRDPRAVVITFVMPVALLIVFGYGVSFDLQGLPLAVVDYDRTEASRQVIDSFAVAEEFDVVARPSQMMTPDELLREGDAFAVLVIPAGLERDLQRGETAEVQLVADGSDGNTARQAIAKAEVLTRAAADDLSRGASEAPQPLRIEVQTFFNSGLRSALFLVPGLAAFLMAVVAVVLTALTISREWEAGSMEQLFATPVGRLEIILGKLIPYLAVGVIQLLLVLVAGAWIFDVPFRGSAVALTLASLLFLLGMLGQGLVVSVVARNQMVATQAATLSAMLPSMLLSGFAFPIENMPKALQAVTFIIPARYFITALRGVLLKGNGVVELWPQFLALTAFAALMITVSTLRFRRRLD